jgi:hypothetical protein
MSTGQPAVKPKIKRHFQVAYAAVGLLFVGSIICLWSWPLLANLVASGLSQSGPSRAVAPQGQSPLKSDAATIALQELENPICAEASDIRYVRGATSCCHQQTAAIRKLYGEAADTLGAPCMSTFWPGIIPPFSAWNSA